MSWSASQYLKFEDERTRPARELLARVTQEQIETAYDLGCGPGNSTELIAARYEQANVIGVDNDDDMLATAKARLPGIDFIKADLGKWLPEEPANLLFANAVFQWIPDHVSVLKQLLLHMTSGGILAVQMPDNLNEPTHLLMEEVAQSPQFADDFEGKSIRRSALPQPKTYFEALGHLCSDIDIWHTVYYHRLANAEAIVEWVQGTGLRPYLTQLPDKRKSEFLSAYLTEISAAYSPLSDGTVLLKFPRLFMVATKT